MRKPRWHRVTGQSAIIRGTGGRAETDRLIEDAVQRRMESKRLVDVVAVLYPRFLSYSRFLPATYRGWRVWVCLAMVLTLTFLSKPLSKTDQLLRTLDYLLVVISIAVGFFFLLPEGIASRVGDSTFTDLALGVIAIFIVLEATRRVAGLSIVFLCLFFLGYAYFRQLFPGAYRYEGIQHREDQFYDVLHLERHLWPAVEGHV